MSYKICCINNAMLQKIAVNRDVYLSYDFIHEKLMHEASS